MSIGHDIPRRLFPAVAQPIAAARIGAALTARDGRVVLVCAPAGCGKTVAIAESLGRDAGAEIRWVTATVDWNPQEFDHGRATVLVVDDAHLLSPAALAWLERFLSEAPATLTMIIAARVEPALRWQALELTGRLVRLGTEDLAFGRDQVRAVVQQHVDRIDETELSTLMELTGGWPALVRIAAAQLDINRQDRVRAFALLARPPLKASEFCTREVLAALTPETRRFLRYTSISESFTEELAAVIMDGESRVALDSLEHTDFPLTFHTADQRLWFRYPEMLRAHLVAELHRREPEILPELHRRIARWYAYAGLPLSALDHLLALPQDTELVEFLRERGMATVLSGAGEALFHRLEQSRPAIAGDAFVWGLRAVHALEFGEAAQGISYLELASNTSRAANSRFAPEMLAALRPALGAALSIAAATDLASVVVPEVIPSTGDFHIDCYAALHIGTILVYRGAGERGEPYLCRTLSLAERGGHPRLMIRALNQLAVAAGMTGALTTLRERATRAVEIAEANALLDTPEAAAAITMAALACYGQGDEWDAGRLLTNLVEHTAHDGSTRPITGWGTHFIAHLLTFDQARDKHAAAQILRHSLLMILAESPNPIAGGAITPAVWALLRIHEHDTAARLLERAHQVLGEIPEITLTRAALADAANKPATVLTLTLPLLDTPAEPHPFVAVTAWLLRATAAHRLGRPMAVYDSLERALRAAEPIRLIRPFFDVPGALELLDAHGGRFGATDAFANLIRGHRDVPRHRSHPTLTTSELIVLKHLPSGRTASQIATALGISVNTVKSHLRAVYAKLGTNSRAAALDQARHAGLL